MPTSPPPPPTTIPALSTDAWRADLQAFADELVRHHRNPFHSVDPETFARKVADLNTRLPALQHYEIVVGIQRLAALIGDGHTRLETSVLYRRVPLDLFWFGDALRVVRVGASHRRALGARLVQIGAHPIDAVHRRLAAIIPQGENAWFELEESARHGVRVEPLRALGLLGPAATGATERSIDYTFAGADGRRFPLRLPTHAPDARVAWLAAAQHALPRQQPDKSFWITPLADKQTLYVCFRGYRDLAEHAAALWSFVDASAPRRLVIDMRHNRGGNYTWGREHLLYPAQARRALNRRGRLYIITGRATFSAAVTNALDFRRETEALLVGEPPGARPSGYQERSVFALPHSGLRVACATRHYRLLPGDPPTLQPDQRIEPNWPAQQAGRDPALDWILAQPVDL